MTNVLNVSGIFPMSSFEENEENINNYYNEKNIQNQLNKEKIVKRAGRFADLEAIKIITKWLKNKRVGIYEVSKSTEFQLALEILKDVNAKVQHVCIAAELVRQVICSLDPSLNCETIFNEIFNLQILLPALMEKQEIDKIKELVKLFVCLGQKLMGNILKRDYTAKILNVIIEFTEYHQFLPLTYGFWRLLASSLKDQNQKNKFRPYIEELILRSAKSLNQFKTKMQKEEIADFEKNLGKFIGDVVKVVDAQQTFDYFCFHLFQPGQTLSVIETSLLFIDNICEFVDPLNNTQVPALVQILKKTNENHPFAAQFLRIIGNLSKWIAHHEATILPFLNIIETMLRVPKFSNLAAETLKLICYDCKNLMLPHIEAFFVIVKNLESFGLDEYGELDIIKALSTAISHLPKSDFEIALRHLCFIQIQKVHQFRDLNPIRFVEQIEEIFAQVSKIASMSGQAAKVFLENWEIFKNMMNFYRNDDKMIKAIFKCIGIALKNWKEPILPKIIDDLLMKIIETNFNSSIDVTCTIFESLEEKIAPKALQLYELLTKKLLQSDEENFSLENFFKMSAIVFEKFPLHFCATQSVFLTIELAMKSLNHNNNAPNALKLIKALITRDSTCNQLLRKAQIYLLTIYGQEIVKKLLMSGVFSFENSNLNVVVEIFCAMKQFSYSAFEELLRTALLQFPNKTTEGKILDCKLLFENFFKHLLCSTNEVQIAAFNSMKRTFTS